MQIPDITKLKWQLNIAIVGAIFSGISLIYNEKYIIYGFLTFLFGIISLITSSWVEFAYKEDELRKEWKKFFRIQLIYFFCWVTVLLFVSEFTVKPIVITNISPLLNNQLPVEWLAATIPIVFGGLIGLFTVIFVEKFKEPELSFDIGSIVDDPQNKRRFIHIKVTNKPKKIWFSPFTTNTATSSKASVKIEDKQFIGRWTSKAEPVIYGPGNQPIAIDVNTVLVTPREDINPASNNEDYVEVAIGIKYDGDGTFYGFNNESYLYQTNLKNTKYEFGTGSFIGEIAVSTLGKQYTHKFIVHNLSTSTQDFKLELMN